MEEQLKTSTDSSLRQAFDDNLRLLNACERSWTSDIGCVLFSFPFYADTKSLSFLFCDILLQRLFFSLLHHLISRHNGALSSSSSSSLKGWQNMIFTACSHLHLIRLERFSLRHIRSTVCAFSSSGNDRIIFLCGLQLVHVNGKENEARQLYSFFFSLSLLLCARSLALSLSLSLTGTSILTPCS